MASSDPGRIFDTLCAYWHTSALTAAIDLGLFTALGTGELGPGQLATRCGADAAALRSLCDALVAAGFLRARRGRYRSTAEAARFLDERSRDALVLLPRFLNAPPVTTAFANLASTVRRRSPVSGAAEGARVWTRCAEATSALRRLAAVDIADEIERRRLPRGRILDVGAGASALGLELLRRTLSSSLVALDRGPVVAVARRLAAAAGVGDRVTTIAGDAATADWGGLFDLVVMVNVLDYFDRRTQGRLARKAREALRPGGALVVAAPLLDASRQSPPDAVAYSLLLLALGARGRPSTYRETRELLLGAGFRSTTRCSDPSLVVARVGR